MAQKHSQLNLLTEQREGARRFVENYINTHSLNLEGLTETRRGIVTLSVMEAMLTAWIEGFMEGARS